MHTIRLIAKNINTINEYKYLGIEYEEKALKNGVFLLYLFEKDFDTCQYDDWFLNMDIAKEVALNVYGIEKDNWEKY